MLFRSAASYLSPRGQKARLSILIFHRVMPRKDDMSPSEPDVARFEQILSWVGQWFRVLPLQHGVRLLREGELPPRAMAITFDDGYADNHDVALPLLQKHGMSATFFIASGFLNGGRMWNDTIIEAMRFTPLREMDLRGIGDSPLGCLPIQSIEQRRAAAMHLIRTVKHLRPEARLRAVEVIADRAECALPTDLMLSTAKLKSLRSAGMDIGAHTVSHPILASLDTTAARREIEAGRSELEAMLGERIAIFAYPNGKPQQDYTPRCVGLVKELGFEAAVTTAPGAMSIGTDPWQIPRFTPWDLTRWRFGVRLMKNLL